MKRIITQFPLLLLASDAVAITAALLLAFYLRVVVRDGVVVPLVWQEFLIVIGLLIPLWLSLFGLTGLYSKPVYERRPSELGRLVFGSCMGLLLMIGVDFILGDVIFHARSVAVYGLVLIFICLIVSRLLMRQLRFFLFRRGLGVVRVVITGNAPSLQAITAALKNTTLSGYKVVAICDQQNKLNQEAIPPQSGYYADTDSLLKDIDKLRPDSLVLASMDQNSANYRKLVGAALKRHIGILLVPSDKDILGAATRLEILEAIPVLVAYQTPLNGWGRIAKRGFDVLAASCGLILMAPVFLVSILAIKLSEPRAPVFYRQKRVTKFGRQVYIYKLRTMKAEYAGNPVKAFRRMGRPDLVEQVQQGKYQLKNDPRVTKVGAFLRPRSIDELPQLVNVLKGDISLVGPRAMTQAELREYKDTWPILLSVKAGLTGLAQVNGRNNISTAEKVRFSVHYAQNWSIWLDISILMKTAVKVIRKEGVIT